MNSFTMNQIENKKMFLAGGGVGGGEGRRGVGG